MTSALYMIIVFYYQIKTSINFGVEVVDFPSEQISDLLAHSIEERKNHRSRMRFYWMVETMIGFPSAF